MLELLHQSGVWVKLTARCSSTDYEPGSEDYEFIGELFGVWYAYHEEYYPTGFEEHRGPDTDAARDAIFAEAEAATSNAEIDAILEVHLVRCGQLEDAVLAKLQ